MAKHYDVAVLGAGVGALAAAALLARRSWRVLVLGQGLRPATYAYDGVTLARRAFTFLAAASPAWGRMVLELAQSQTFRRRLLPLDPMLQMLGAGSPARCSLGAAALRAGARPRVPGRASRGGRALRGAGAHERGGRRGVRARRGLAPGDVLGAPGDGAARRRRCRTSRTKACAAPRGAPARPRYRDRRRLSGALRELRRRHPVVRRRAPARRLDARRRSLARGEDELTSSSSSACARTAARRSSPIARRHHPPRRAGHAVVVDGDEAPTGVQFVVADLPMHALLDLAPTIVRRAPRHRRASAPRRRRAALRRQHRRARRGDSRAARRRVFPLAGPRPRRIPRVRSTCSVRDRRASRGRRSSSPRRFSRWAATRSPPSRARPSSRTLERFFRSSSVTTWSSTPSTTAGRSGTTARTGARRAIDRAQLRASGASIDAEPMALRWNVDPPSLHGLAGEPLRAPLGGGYIAGGRRCRRSVRRASCSRPGARRGSSRGPTGARSRCGARCGARWSSDDGRSRCAAS